MHQFGNRANLVKESLEQIGTICNGARQDLQSDLPVHRPMFGSKHFAHATGTDAFEQEVLAENAQRSSTARLGIAAFVELQFQRVVGRMIGTAKAGQLVIGRRFFRVGHRAGFS